MATKKSKSKKFKISKSYIALIFIFAVVALLLIIAKPTLKAEAPEISPPVTAAPPATIPEVPAAQAPAAEEKIVSAFPGGIPPQLEIISLINTPTFPKAGELTLIRLYVKNVGSDSTVTTATIKINDNVVSTLGVPSIYRNAQTVLQYNWTATAAGDYNVTADVAPAAGETVLDDNTAKITFTVM